MYLIDESEAALIDPGPSATVPAILEAMKELGMKELSYIILTHVHMDHAGATGTLTALFPNAKAVVHPLGVKHLVDPSRLILGTKKVYGEDFAERYGKILPVSADQVIALQDGTRVSIGGRELQAVHCPGHSEDHIAIYDGKTRGLFCGEALGARTKSAGTTPLPNASPPSFDMEAYLTSIAKLAALRPEVLFYAHDGVARDPGSLIAQAAESTKVFGRIIGAALERGETPESVDRAVRNHISTEMGVNLAEVDVRMAVNGFIHYFRRKGIVPGKE